MIIEITLSLLFLFISSLIIYWVIHLKVEDKNKKVVIIFYNFHSVIWAFSLITVPFINSSFLRFYLPENLSYFKDYWILFALLGIVFILLGINFARRASKLKKNKIQNENNSELITSGVFRIIRHPTYSAWIIIFFGIALISDSLVSLIFCPIISLILEIHASIEEKLILIPRYGNDYENFKEKSPSRIIPTPLNLLLIIIAMIIVYVGFLNFS